MFKNKFCSFLFMDLLPINTSEQEAIANLRDLLVQHELTSNFSFSDTTILRFLRGKKHNEKLAFDGLKKFAAWYIENEVELIPNKQESFQKELNKKLLTFGTKDKNNRPILYHFPHRHRTNDRVLKDMTNYMIYSLTSTLQLSKPEEERLVIVSYLGQFTFSCMDFECTNVFITLLQSHYPESLHLCLVVDAPIIFSGCWAIIRAWLDPVTAEKVKFIKRAELGSYIDEDEIPLP